MIWPAPDAFHVKKQNPTISLIDTDLFDNKLLTPIKDYVTRFNVLCLLHGITLNDVLDFSKIEAGQLTLAINPFSIMDVIQGVVASTQPLATEKNLSLKVTVPADLPAALGDERRITQVLLNLVGNAIKFTDAGEIQIEAGAVDGEWVVSVSDTGSGISEADRENIFEEFRQAEGSIVQRKGGTGLGLAIAKRIVELHGGKIWERARSAKALPSALPYRRDHRRQAEWLKIRRV